MILLLGCSACPPDDEYHVGYRSWKVSGVIE